MRPLDGIRVLDFSTLLPGPLATLLLAEAGAEVIKIERPGRGDEMRSYEPRWGADSVNFALLNRGKKSIAADLKDPAPAIGCSLLAKSADVVVEQFRPGVMDRLGLGYEAHAGAESAHHLLRDHRLRPERAARAIAPRTTSTTSATRGCWPSRRAAGRARGAAGADRRHRRRRLSRGDEHPARAAPPRCHRRGRQSRHRHGRQPVHVPVLGDRQRSRRRAMARQRHRPRHRRHAALSAVRDRATAASRLLRRSSSGSGSRSWPPSASSRRSRRRRAIPPPPRPASPRSSARAMRPTGRAIFDAADCCCSIVQDVQAALADAHFRGRGLFAHVLTNEAGARMPALPVPISDAFRAAPAEAEVGAGARGHTTGRSRREGGRRSRVCPDRAASRSASCPTLCPAKARSSST